MDRAYEGADVLDASGDKIGHVERSYVDDQGAVRMVEVKMGSLFAKHRLVPVEGSSLTDAGLQLPFDKDMVSNSPDLGEIGDTVDGAALSRVDDYYNQQLVDATDSGMVQNQQPTEEVPAVQGNAAGQQPPGAVPLEDDNGAGDTAANQIQGQQTPVSQNVRTEDIGDGEYIEIPVVDERLVKQRYVKEVLRVRKQDIAEMQTVSGDVRREDIEVDRPEQTTSGADQTTT